MHFEREHAKTHAFLNSRLEPQKQGKISKNACFLHVPFQNESKIIETCKEKINFFDVFQTFPAIKVEISEMELDRHAF